MEEITDGANNMKRNRIQVSNTKKPLFFYVNLAKRYMQQFNEVELSALGMVVTVAEILKNNGLAVEKRKTSLRCFKFQNLDSMHPSTAFYSSYWIFYISEIATSTVDISDDSRPRPVQKARIEIVLVKTEKFDELMAAAEEERRAEEGLEQS
ncbi:unnamed protein product [Rhodiola kirilowii]